MEQTELLIASLLGIVVFLLVEGIKLIARILGRPLSSKAKTYAALVIAYVMSFLAALATGELDLSVWLASLVEVLGGFGDAPLQTFLAIVQLARELSELCGPTFAIAVALYATLKEKLKEGGLLSFRRMFRGIRVV